jgi:CDP-diacylglycerol--serine O-phosphatidyltransferase
MDIETPRANSHATSASSAPKRRFRRLRMRPGMHIYVLPNLITTMNMFFGFVAIVQAIDRNFTFAAYAIVAAAVFDTLDGRVARMTQSMSKFGAEYDSLCDLVSFGLAPSLLLYLWALQPFGRIGWLAAFLFAACGALRLARFNVQVAVIEKGYFQGLPIPMAAGIVASSVLAFDNMGWNPQRSYTLLFMTMILAFVMVSTFRYRSFKDVDFKRRLPFHYLVAGLIVIYLVAIRPEVMLFILFFGYAATGAVFGILNWGKPPKQAALVTAVDLDQDGGDDLHEAIESDENEDEEPLLP